MPEKVVDAEVIAQIVTCRRCGKRNRLRVNAARGQYRCGSCHAEIDSPFERPRFRVPKLPAWIGVAARRHRKAGVLILLGVVVFYWVWHDATERRQKEFTRMGENYVPPPPPPPPPPPFQEPELDLPENGEVHTYTSSEPVAPFEIKTFRGSNYLVKLEDASTHNQVLTVFVRGGERLEIKVPLGTHILKYMTGAKWYGYRYNFGPSGVASQASSVFDFRTNGSKVQGHTITLYVVPGGNLPTRRIGLDAF